MNRMLKYGLKPFRMVFNVMIIFSLICVGLYATPCNKPNHVNPNSNSNLRQEFMGPFNKHEVNGQWVWNAPAGVAALLSNNPDLQHGTAMLVAYQVTDNQGSPVAGAQLDEQVVHQSGPEIPPTTANVTTNSDGEALDTLVVQSSQALTETTTYTQGLSINGDCVKVQTLSFGPNGVSVQ